MAAFFGGFAGQSLGCLAANSEDKSLLPAARTDQRWQGKCCASSRGSEVGVNVCLRAPPQNILDRCSQLYSGEKLEHQFRDVLVSKGTTWKRAGHKVIKTETLVSTVTTPETK